MTYGELLSEYIEKSGLSLGDIALRLKNKGIKIDRSYVSKLKTGARSAASEDVTRALAEVTGGDAESLLLAGTIEKAPPEVQEQLRAAHKFHLIFMLAKFLADYLEYYREHGEVNKDFLDKIEFSAGALQREFKHFVQLSPIYKYPEYAATLLAQLKYYFFQGQDTVTHLGHEIDLRSYVKDNGEPIFKENPYPALGDEASKDYQNLVAERNALYKQNVMALVDGGNEKMIFLENLERELGIDFRDPDIQKRLKRAAKIVFTDEE